MLDRRTVLITRPPPEAEETAAQVAALGWKPLITPLFHVRPLPFRAAAAQAVLVSSGNALASLPPGWHGTPMLAVGDRTAARAQAMGFQQVVSADGDAAALVALTQRRFPSGTTLLLAAGRGQGHALAAALRAAGYRVHRRVTYATGPVPRLPHLAAEALTTGRVRAVLFLSAETARIFRRVLPDCLRTALCEVDALAIAGPAALVLNDLPWRQLRVSGKPTVERVLALL